MTLFVIITGTAVSSHWVANLSGHNSPTKGVTDLPMWSVRTFTATAAEADSRPGSSAEGQERYLGSQPPSSFTTMGAGQSQAETSPAALTKEEQHGSPKKSITPKRVAPPPPKNKKGRKNKEERERAASVEYEVPVVGQRWFSRRKKSSMMKSNYKELNLQQVQPPSTYTTPAR